MTLERKVPAAERVKEIVPYGKLKAKASREITKHIVMIMEHQKIERYLQKKSIALERNAIFRRDQLK